MSFQDLYRINIICIVHMKGGRSGTKVDIERRFRLPATASVRSLEGITNLEGIAFPSGLAVRGRKSGLLSWERINTNLGEKTGERSRY